MVLLWLKRFLRPVTPLCSASELTASALKQHERGIHAR
jgi:hypothetical protein